MAKERIEHGQLRKLGQLKPHPKNSKTHPQAQIDALVAAMTEWDWTRPLLIDDKDTILAGHGAVQAGLIKFGADHEVPVSIVHGWNDAKKRRYIIADNKLTELSQWNSPVLQAELRELSDLGDVTLKPMGLTKLAATAILEPPAPQKSSRIGSPVLSYQLVFDNETQQKEWFDFLRKLKASYPERPTIAAKLSSYLQDQNG